METVSTLSSTKAVETGPPYRRFAGSLDFCPKLSLWQKSLCVAASLGFCAPLLTLGLWETLWFKALCLPLFAVIFLILHQIFLERLHTKFQRPEEELADPDSIFLEVHGVKVHYKCKRPAHGKVRMGIHLLHGVANNLYLWEDGLTQLLAEKFDACVVSSDLVGHGLSERPTSLKYYKNEFNGILGRHIMEHELEKSSLIGSRSGRIVLIGNSVGGLIQMMEAIRQPQGIAAIIVTSPVLLFDDFTNASMPAGVLQRLSLIVSVLWKTYIIRSLKAFLIWALQPFLFLRIRAGGRQKKFWSKSLSRAYSSSQMVEKVVDRFRLAFLVRGFEWGTMRFNRSLLFQSNGSRSIADIWNNRPGNTFILQLAETIKKHDIRVLVIHGEEDQHVPLAGSERLCKEIPSIKLIKYPNCRHVANEEYPDQFLNDVIEFLKDI